MKLREIYNTGIQSVSTIPLERFDMEHAVIVAPAEAPFSVIRTHALTDSSLILYGITNGKRILSMVVGKIHTIFNQPFFVIGGSWTEPDWRKKGLMTSLYIALVKQLNLKLMSDREQSPEMFKLWKALQLKGLAHVVDTSTGDIVNVSDDELFQDTDLIEDRYRFVLEHSPQVIPDVGVGILYEYQNYTHPNNEGDYD